MLQRVITKNTYMVTSRLLASSAGQSKKGENLPDTSSVELDSAMFEDIRNRLQMDGKTLEKVVVNVKSDGEKTQRYLLNRNLSSPFTCAKHISTVKLNHYGLAKATYESGSVEFLSMGEPIGWPCSLEYVEFNAHGSEDVQVVNEAFWRSSSVLLEATLRAAIQKPCNITSTDSKPSDTFFAVSVKGLEEKLSLSQEELDSLTTYAYREIISKNLPFEVINVPESISNDYDLEANTKLCRLGNYVTVLNGPAIANSSQIGKFKIVEAVSHASKLVFGGVSLPFSQPVTSYNWSVIAQHSGDKFLSSFSNK